MSSEDEIHHHNALWCSLDKPAQTPPPRELPVLSSRAAVTFSFHLQDHNANVEKALKPASLESYKPRQVAEASLLVHDFLIHGSRDWVKIVDRYTAGVIFTTAYGRRIESMDAKVIKRK